MKRYTFSNFVVNEGNRDAYEAACRVADLEAVAPLPLLLLGDEGCGKTHLLYAIVNRLRASSSKTGLAYVTAHDFPDQVRALVDDPSPVARAKSAVLLVDQLDSVDQLERSSDLVEELEAVIRIFLDHNHYVVLASNVHPGRLKHLSDGFRALIEGGQIVSMRAPSADNRLEIVEQRVRQESEDVIARQRQEIEKLCAELETLRRDAGRNLPASGGSFGSQAERTDLEHRLEVAKAFGESLQRDLTMAREELDALRSGQAGATQAHESVAAELAAAQQETARLNAQLNEVSAAQAELQRLQEQVDRLEQERSTMHAEADAGRARREAEAGRLESLEREIDSLKGELQAAAAQATRVQELEAERETLSRSLAVAQEEAQEKQGLQIRLSDLEGELGQARAESAEARDEANRLLERAEGLLELVEANRSRFSEVEEQQRNQIEELEGLLAQRSVRAEELEAAKSRALAAMAQLDEQRQTFEVRERELADRITEALAEAQGVRDAHDRTKAERDQVKANLEAHQAENQGLREELEEHAQRNDELRRRFEDAQETREKLEQQRAAQVAEADARISALEGRIAALEPLLANLRASALTVASDLSEFASEMRHGAEELLNTAERLHTAVPEEEGASEEAVSEEAEATGVEVTEVAATPVGQAEASEPDEGETDAAQAAAWENDWSASLEAEAESESGEPPAETSEAADVISADAAPFAVPNGEEVEPEPGLEEKSDGTNGGGATDVFADFEIASSDETSPNYAPFEDEIDPSI